MNGARTRFVTLLLLACEAAAGQERSVADRVEAARALRAGGATQKALDAYEESLRDLRNSGPQDLLVTVLLEAAQTSIAAGDYSRAIRYGGSAADSSVAMRDVKKEGLARNVLGQAHLYQGSYETALAAFQRAYDLAESQNDANAASIRLGNMGNVRFFQGRYLDALESYERALRRSEPAPGGASNASQLALANLAILYEQLGQNEKALEYYQRAAASASALKPSEYGQLLSNMGTLYRRMGDPDKALRTYDAARQVFRRVAHSDGEIHVLHNTGLVLALDRQALGPALKAFTDALKLADRTANRRQAMLGRLFRGEALLRMKRFAEARAEYNLALAAARSLGTTDEEWTADYGIGRTLEGERRTEEAARAYRDSIAAIEKLRGGLGASTLKTEFLGNKRSVYDAAIGMALASRRRDPEDVFSLFEKARARNLQDVLRRQLELPTIAKVQQRLDRSSLFVEYWIGAGRAAALWITDRASGIVETPDAGDAVAHMQRLAHAFGAGEDASWRSDADALGRVLLRGLPFEDGRSNLIVVPDGVLCAVPFDVLPRGGNGRMLVESVAVSYLPAAALLLRADGGRRPAPPWSRQLLVFGDPLMPGGDALSPDGWPRLPAAVREAHYAARGIPGRAVLRLGRDNLKRYLTEGAANGVPILHLSTHAAIDTVDPNRSRILFTPEPGNSGSRYLFWPEAQSLPLTGVDLVTLAACETERGKIVPGEGTQSFSRAFLASGARSTVTALWRVADGPSAELMRAFYRELGRGVPKAEALRRAKVALFESAPAMRSPQFWAAFVFTGDGRRRLPVEDWWILAVPVACAAAACAAAVLLRARWAARK